MFISKVFLLHSNLGFFQYDFSYHQSIQKEAFKECLT